MTPTLTYEENVIPFMYEAGTLVVKSKEATKASRNLSGEGISFDLIETDWKSESDASLYCKSQ